MQIKQKPVITQESLNVHIYPFSSIISSILYATKQKPEFKCTISVKLDGKKESQKNSKCKSKVSINPSLPNYWIIPSFLINQPKWQKPKPKIDWKKVGKINREMQIKRHSNNSWCKKCKFPPLSFPTQLFLFTFPAIEHKAKLKPEQKNKNKNKQNVKKHPINTCQNIYNVHIHPSLLNYSPLVLKHSNTLNLFAQWFRLVVKTDALWRYLIIGLCPSSQNVV